MSWKVSILISYVAWSKDIEEELRRREGQYNLYLDSGAFTAYKQGIEIDFDEYCAFVRSPPVHIDRYFMLDVIGDPVKTRRNLDKMWRKGVRPIPIFTRGQNINEFGGLYGISDLVALGGIAGTNGAREYVKWIMPHVGDRKVHWLGFSDLDFLKHYAPYACDTLVYASAGLYSRGVLYGRDARSFTRKSYTKVPGLRKYCLDRGLDYYSLKSEEIGWRNRHDWGTAQQISALSFLEFAKRMEVDRGVHIHLVAMGTHLSSSSSLAQIFRMAEKGGLI
jgi:hypothetical protein